MSPVEMKKTRNIKKIEIKQEEQTNEKQTDKTQATAKSNTTVSHEEKIQKMISSHMSSLLKKFDLKKIQQAQRIKI